LYQKQNNILLSPENQKILDYASPALMFRATISSIQTLPKSLKIFKVGDILRYQLNIKYRAITKKKTNQFIDIMNDSSITSKSDVLKPDPFLTKKVVVFFAVTAVTGDIQIKVLAHQLEAFIWRQHLSHMTTDQVFLETSQIKIVHPKNCISGLYSFGSLTPGTLDSDQNSTSSRTLTLKMGSPFINASLDHHTLRLYGSSYAKRKRGS